MRKSIKEKTEEANYTLFFFGPLAPLCSTLVLGAILCFEAYFTLWLRLFDVLLIKMVALILTFFHFFVPYLPSFQAYTLRVSISA